MDNSDNISTNDLSTNMGSILSSSNDTGDQPSENTTENTDNEASTLTSENIEVNATQTTIIDENIPSTSNLNVEIDTAIASTSSYIDNKDIDLLTIETEPKIDDELLPSCSQESVKSTSSNVEDNVDLWLDGNTRELASKADTEEDFDVIVKSLETAIVETERYDIESVQEPIISSIASTSNLEPASLLDDLAEQLNSPSNSLTGMEVEGPMMLNDDIQDFVPQTNITGLDPDMIIQDGTIIPVITTRSVSNYRPPQRPEPSAPVIETDFVPTDDDIDAAYDDQTTSLFENPIVNRPAPAGIMNFHISTLADVSASLRNQVENAVQQQLQTLGVLNIRDNNVNPEIDPEMSESSIVYSSTEEMNEEENLLNTTVDSNESDFTLRLDDEAEVPTMAGDLNNTELDDIDRLDEQRPAENTLTEELEISVSNQEEQQLDETLTTVDTESKETESIVPQEPEKVQKSATETLKELDSSEKQQETIEETSTIIDTDSKQSENNEEHIETELKTIETETKEQENNKIKIVSDEKDNLIETKEEIEKTDVKIPEPELEKSDNSDINNTLKETETEQENTDTQILESIPEKIDIPKAEHTESKEINDNDTNNQNKTDNKQQIETKAEDIESKEIKDNDTYNQNKIDNKQQRETSLDAEIIKESEINNSKSEIKETIDKQPEIPIESETVKEKSETITSTDKEIDNKIISTPEVNSTLEETNLPEEKLTEVIPEKIEQSNEETVIPEKNEQSSEETVIPEKIEQLSEETVIPEKIEQSSEETVIPEKIEQSSEETVEIDSVKSSEIVEPELKLREKEINSENVESASVETNLEDEKRETSETQEISTLSTDNEKLDVKIVEPEQQLSTIEETDLNSDNLLIETKESVQEILTSNTDCNDSNTEPKEDICIPINIEPTDTEKCISDEPKQDTSATSDLDLNDKLITESSLEISSISDENISDSFQEISGISSEINFKISTVETIQEPLEISSDSNTDTQLIENITNELKDEMNTSSDMELRLDEDLFENKEEQKQNLEEKLIEKIDTLPTKEIFSTPDTEKILIEPTKSEELKQEVSSSSIDLKTIEKPSEIVQIIDDKSNKHSIEETDDKIQTPPKKVKLIREKLPINIATIEKPKLETKIETEIAPEPEKAILSSIQEDKQPELIKTNIQEQIQEEIKIDTPVLEPVIIEQKEIEEKSTTPVKVQKLKLKRNYESPPPIIKPQIIETSSIITEKIEDTINTEEKPIEPPQIKSQIIEKVQEFPKEVIVEKNIDVDKEIITEKTEAKIVQVVESQTTEESIKNLIQTSDNISENETNKNILQDVTANIPEEVKDVFNLDIEQSENINTAINLLDKDISKQEIEFKNDIIENKIATPTENIEITQEKENVSKLDKTKKIEIEYKEQKIIESDNLIKETGTIIDVDNYSNNPSTSLINKDKIKEPETENINTIKPVQFPLLMSRLQERLQRSPTKTSKAQSLSPIPKETPYTNIEIPKILEQKEIIEPETSRKDTETISTKIRILKRKHDAEPMVTHCVTKPLSVEVDDFECSEIIQPAEGKEHENIPKLLIKQIPKPEQRSSPKILIKPIKPPDSPEISGSKKMKISDESVTPKITIKPLIKQDSLKFTITKQKSDDTHSILKIYQPEDSQMQMDEIHVPKLTIKPIPKSDEMQHSPKITIKPPGSPKITVKQIPPPSDQHIEITHSPKIPKQAEESYPKVTIKPVIKPEDTQKVPQLSSRQLKVKSMTFDSSSGVTVEPICSPSTSTSQKIEHESPMKISVKPFAKIDENLGPKLTIKPITKTCEIVQSEDGTANPLKLTIKPILKSEEQYQSPKITIKPIVKLADHDQLSVVEELEKPERIILKIQKTNLPSPKERTSTHVKESKKDPDVKIDSLPHQETEKSQKLDKIKLKLTKEGSHAQIIPSITTSHVITETSTSFSLKRTIPITNTNIPEKIHKPELTEFIHSSDISINIVEPNSKPNLKQISEEVTIVKIDKSSGNITKPPPSESLSHIKFKEMLLKISQKPDITCTPHIQHIQTQHEDSSSSDDVKIVEVIEDPLSDPLHLHDESSSQDVVIVNEVINTNPFKNVQIINAQSLAEPVTPSPKKRGRPRKVPLEVKPEIKGEDCILPDVVSPMAEPLEGGRPKRTCRAPPGRTPFVVKERKPRGAGRGRGSRGARGAKALTPIKSPKEPKSPRSKALKEAKALAKIEAIKLAQEVVIDEITIEDSTNDTPTPAHTPIPSSDDSPKKSDVTGESINTDKKITHISGNKMSDINVKMTEIASMSDDVLKHPLPPSVTVYEEETRMSASENSSRAHTPARQVFIVPISAEGPEESQSSVQSTATTESTKQSKKGRLEICDPDSAVTTVEQIVEYSWGNGGPYMLQEQIAQFLGVKSFKRKYPGLTRRPVDMQERDYIKEKGLVSESMCDMGLTAVPSSEILDIMYTDFQDKYEEYRKCLRDKQSKEISNKQKAISLATSQEKNKIDFKERAIRSAANWNLTFNKARKESRKSCMDLQTFTVNFPTGETQAKVPQKYPVGNYPIALVPGQFTDYFKSYSPAELNYLPLNTVRYGPVLPNQRYIRDGSQSDGSQSDSDSSSGSDSDSSDESMSTDDDIKPSLTPIMSAHKQRVH